MAITVKKPESKKFTTKKAEINLRRAEKLEAQAERLREGADRRTKKGKAAVEKAKGLEAQARKYRQTGLEEREKVKRENKRQQTEYNARIYNAIQVAMMERRAKLAEMDRKGTRRNAGNEQLMDLIDTWEDRLLSDFDGVLDEVYQAFSDAYKKEPDIFEEWIYYSEGTKLSESWMVLEDILRQYGNTMEEDVDEDFEVTFA